MNPEITEQNEQENRITEAFGDLARRANAVDVDHGPHMASGRARGGAATGGRLPLLPALAFAVLAAIVGFGGWQLLSDDGTKTNIATDDIEDNNDAEQDGVSEDGSGDDGDGSTFIGAITEVSGTPDVPFVLVESEDGTRAGYPSIPNSWIDLPSDAQDALPDGNGGVFYRNDDSVYHQAAGEAPTIVAVTELQPPQFISVRMVNGRQAVLAQIDGDLVAFFADGSVSSRPLAEFGFDGIVDEIAIDGTTLVAIVSHGELSSVMTASLTGDRPVWNALPASSTNAPLDIALAGDRLVIGTIDSVRTYDLPADDDQAIPLTSFPLPGNPLETGWWSFDAAGAGGGSKLIIGFGESALTIDLDTRDRDVPDTDGWVRSAHWAFDPIGGVLIDPGQVAVEQRYRVDTAKVAADAADPFLNVRSGPGIEQTLVAKLPPNYKGLLTTGEISLDDDGAFWVEVELLDPVHLVGDGPESTLNNPTGWVNRAFTEWLRSDVSIGIDELPGCSGGDFGQLGGGLTGEAYIYGLESNYLSDSCLRVVLTVGEGQAPLPWDDIPEGTNPASSLPAITNPISGGYGSIVDLGNTTSAWPAATETDDGVYIVRGTNGNLQLVVPLLIDGMNITPLPESGIVVVDIDVEGPAVVQDRSVVLTDAPIVGDGSISVAGIARPFEANLEVSVVDANGDPATAVFSGSSFLGTIETDQYGVSTNDWITAWGRFAVKVDGLGPGSYTLLLDSDGGSETQNPTRIAFTITEGANEALTLPSDSEQAAALALIRFAQGGPFDDVPLADEVTLSLGLGEQAVHTRDELAERDNWFFAAEDGFGGFSGPFSVLETLDGPGARSPEISTGAMPFCAGPPKNWPAEWQSLDQVNIEPAVIPGQSCISWFGVSLFLNADSEIEVIALDHFGP